MSLYSCGDNLPGLSSGIVVRICSHSSKAGRLPHTLRNAEPVYADAEWHSTQFLL
jgi:hypothetical protein